MAHWLIYLKNTEGKRMYKCSKCKAMFLENFINELEDIDKCPVCGETITGSAVVREMFEMLMTAEQTQKIADECKEKSETEQFKEYFKQNRQRKPGTFERYMNDVREHLADKFPDADVATIMDAASYISNRASVMCADLMWERDREWKRIMRQQSPKVKRRDE